MNKNSRLDSTSDCTLWTVRMHLCVHLDTVEDLYRRMQTDLSKQGTIITMYVAHLLTLYRNGYAKTDWSTPLAWLRYGDIQFTAQLFNLNVVLTISGLSKIKKIK